jgi:hypothetical protein
LEGVCYRAGGDVIAVERVENSAGETVDATGFRQNMMRLNPDAPETETLAAYGIDFIFPFKFVVLSQNLSKENA